MSELEHLDFGLSPSGDGAGAGAAVDRAISPVAGRQGGVRNKLAVFAGLSLGCGGVLLLMTAAPRRSGPPSPPTLVRQVVSFDAVKAKGLDDPAAAPAGASPASAAAAATASAALQAELDGALSSRDGESSPSAASLPGAPALSPAQAARQAIRSAPLIAYEAERPAARLETAANELTAGAASAASAVLGGASGLGETGAAGAPSGETNPLDKLRQSSTLDLVRAGRLPDRNFLIAAGALLPCVLETALDSSAPGYVACRLSRDVYSDNGRVVLLEKGSRALGEYRAGLAQGQGRLFVLWDRITTPGGVVVDVRSPAADALGRAGFEGAVDTHFWARFGGALLLSAVNGAFSAAATAQTRYPGLLEPPQDAASVTLQNTLNIAPTLTKPQGAQVSIFVSRDLDFSGVYALKPR